LSLGNTTISRDPEAIQFLQPVTAEGKTGWTTELELPLGVTAKEVIGRREKFARNLGRHESCVELKEGEYGGSLVVRVSREPVHARKQGAWPLLDAKRHDFFDRFPLAADNLGETIDASLAGTNVVVAAMPEGGKTLTILLMLLAASLDERSELWMAEHKGTADFRALRDLASVYISGAADDDEATDASLNMLQELDRECGRRARLIAESGQSKVTNELANSPGLHPLVVVIDECQVVLKNPKAVELAASIVERDRALGITLILATQTPDKQSLPEAIMKKVRTRWCGEQEGHVGTDAVLGTAAWAEGARPRFGLPGMGILKGQHSTMKTGRTYFVPDADVARVVDRALALRHGKTYERNLMQGQSEDKAPTPTGGLLGDVLRAFEEGENGIWWNELTERLATNPQYSGITVDEIRDQLRTYGVKTWQVMKRGTNRRGVRLIDIQTAMTKEN
jgi:DNA segregation ATPase FtsK/SpoIIIE, S-DNA-T family